MEQQQFTFDTDPVGALEELIAFVLADSTLESNARRLLQILRYHKGPANPRSGQELAAQLNLGEREVKQLAKMLTEQYAIPVGANRQPPYGYWLCVTAEDRERAGLPHLHQALSELRRYRALCPHKTILELLGQAELEKEKSA